MRRSGSVIGCSTRSWCGVALRSTEPLVVSKLSACAQILYLPAGSFCRSLRRSRALGKGLKAQGLKARHVGTRALVKAPPGPPFPRRGRRKQTAAAGGVSADLLSRIALLSLRPDVTHPASPYVG